MTKIFLVRHGESQWNVLKKVQGQQDILLTDKGILQANLIGDRLINEYIDKIYSSDLRRAYDTAVIIGKKIGLNNVIPIKEFREINFGKWEGMNHDELYKEYHNEIQIWRRNPKNLNLKGAETLRGLQARVMRGMNKVLANNAGNNILIVSHGVALKTMILGLLDMDLSYYKNLTLNNTSLTIIEDRDYNRVIRVLNDTYHTKEKYQNGK